MPLFDFHCTACEQAFELLVRSSKEKLTCTHCGSAEVEKQLALVAVKGLKADHVHTGSCGCGKTPGSCGAN